jgi:3-hydroxyisobutyrate dehydrogenase-like beta-hydroxyacid dehydrogenase
MSQKPQIAVVGTGIMGAGIVRNFLENGYVVRVWNRSEDKVAPLKEAGAEIAMTPKEAADGAGIVFEVTANDESSKAVWFGDEGILAGAKDGAALITCATLSTDWTDELAKTCTEKGHPFFDMPMTGGRKGAETGSLVLLAGGDESELKKIRTDLEAISRNVRLFGPVGSGMRYKLILNSLQAVLIAEFGEAMRMAKAAGLNDKAASEALAELPGGYTLELMNRFYPEGPESVNFAVDWITKDLKYAKQMLPDADLPLLEKALAEYEAKIKDGDGQADWSAIAYPKE